MRNANIIVSWQMQPGLQRRWFNKNKYIPTRISTSLLRFPRLFCVCFHVVWQFNHNATFPYKRPYFDVALSVLFDSGSRMCLFGKSFRAWMHPTAVTAVGCCRAPMPTAGNSVVRIRGDVPQLWQLWCACAVTSHRCGSRVCIGARILFHEIEYEIVS